jgi:hypothetical protein
MAKLRFRDPDLSVKEGKDHLFYLWLSDVLFHPNEGLISGVFFEVPAGFEKWHQVGKILGFEPEIESATALLMSVSLNNSLGMEIPGQGSLSRTDLARLTEENTIWPLFDLRDLAGEWNGG